MRKAHLEERFMDEREARSYRWKLRRRRELRNRWMLMIFTVCLIIGFALSFNALISRAESEAAPEGDKYYGSVMVEYGDTLWSIASRYVDGNYISAEDYIREVMRINHLQESGIKAGQHIIIPYYSCRN